MTTVKQILNTVSEVTGLSHVALTGQRQDHRSAHARFLVFWLAREQTGQSFPQIARAVGNRDHTTVIHGARRWEDLRRYPVYRQWETDARARLGFLEVAA